MPRPAITNDFNYCLGCGQLRNQNVKKLWGKRQTKSRTGLACYTARELEAGRHRSLLDNAFRNLSLDRDMTGHDIDMDSGIRFYLLD